MKPLRSVLPIALLPVCAVAYTYAPGTFVTLSDAQESFDLLKALSGTWQGPVTTDHPAWSTDEPLHISMSVASRGNVVVHELMQGGTPELTVFYVDSDRLTLVHYCDYGSRSHMVARPLREGKTIEFDLVDYSGRNEIGHVTHAVFTALDADHHVEDWTFALADGTPVRAHMDLTRVQ